MPDRRREPLVHLDMPGWFRSAERVPALPTLAEALHRGTIVEISHRAEGGESRRRRVSPLGLVNKAGTWYLVAAVPRVVCFRVARIVSARVLPASGDRPQGFDLVDFWRRWSEEFTATRARLPVRLRASPEAVEVLPEILGDGVREALDSASPPDTRGWRTLTLHFEHEPAAATRLAGLGGAVEVLDPPSLRARLEATARAILDRYRPGREGVPRPRVAVPLD
jgi:predicted DNA-binding transcriptional regulator YafY